MDGRKVILHIFILCVICFIPFIGLIGCGGIDCDNGCVISGCHKCFGADDCVGCLWSEEFGILKQENSKPDISMYSCFNSYKYNTGCLSCSATKKSATTVSAYCYNCFSCEDETTSSSSVIVNSILDGACGIGCQNGCFEKDSACVICSDCGTGCIGGLISCLTCNAPEYNEDNSISSLNGCTFGCVGGCPTLKCGEDTIYKLNDAIYKLDK